MKIAHICQSYPPMVSGQSYMVERLALGAISLGHEAMVICASDRPQAYTETRGKLHIVRMASLRNPFRIGQRFTPWGAGEMKRALAAFSPDVVQLHDPSNSGLAGLSAAHSLGIPVLFTTHAGPWLLRAYLPHWLRFLAGPLEWFAWVYGRWFMRRCEAVAAPSSKIAKLIAEKTGIRPVLISNGADLSRFYPSSNLNETKAIRKRYKLPSNVPLILYVGRLDTDKNISVAIQAAALAMQESDAHLVIAGDGVEREALTKLCKKLGIAKRSQFLGYVDFRKELPALYRAATVFVTASEMEVQSLVMLEAIASGVPMVAVDATSVSELVKHGVSGYLIQSGEIQKMGRYIAELVSKPAQAKAFGKQARKIAERHTLERTFKNYERLYKTLAAKSPSRLVGRSTSRLLN